MSIEIEIPKQIKIGAYNYRITYVPNLAYDYKLLGQSLADKQVIKVDPDTTDETKNVTLWHEIVHAISDVFSCELDERNVDRIAQGVAALLRDSFGLELDWTNISE